VGNHPQTVLLIPTVHDYYVVYLSHDVYAVHEAVLVGTQRLLNN
jgi:hypothetical protein